MTPKGCARRPICGVRTIADAKRAAGAQHDFMGAREVHSVEHRGEERLSTAVPVRLRCVQSSDSGCRCVGCLVNVSVSGALIRTELGICPSAHIAVETLSPALGLQGRELPAHIVRAGSAEIAVEWTDFAATGARALLTETRLTASGGNGGSGRQRVALGRVRFCARAPA